MDRSEADHNEAQSLLLAARKDWQALDGMRDETVFADEIFGFHAQQAVEKTLEAWLALSGVEYPRTHDISLLLSALRLQEQDGMCITLLEFNPYAVQFRYTAFRDWRTVKSAEAIKCVEELLRRVGLPNLLICSADKKHRRLYCARNTRCIALPAAPSVRTLLAEFARPGSPSYGSGAPIRRQPV